jgi:hypothetical protein
VTSIARILAILTCGAIQAMAQSASAGCCQPVVMNAPMCQMPLTKSYRIEPNFCPQQLVCMIPQCVPAGGSCASCGPYGVPPIFAAGSYVVVRQTPEVHERIAKFLTDLGAFVAPQPLR